MRLDLVGRDAERPARSGSGRRRPEAEIGELPNRGHQLVGGQRLRPLTDLREIARVERQRASAGFPHAVPVAEARERPVVPVLDDARPGVAERLAVDRRQASVNRDGPGPRARLPIEAEILERERPHRFLPAAERFARGRERAHRRFLHPVRDVAHRGRAAQRVQPNVGCQPRRVVTVRVALVVAVEPVHEERAIEVDDVALLGGRRGAALDRRQARVEREPQPSVGRRRGHGLKHHEIRRRDEASFVPVRREQKRYRRLRRRDRGRRKNFRVEARGIGRAHARPLGGRQAGPLPLVAFVTRGRVRQHIGRAHRLVEAEREDRGLIVPAVRAIPLRLQQADRRRGEGERVAARQLPSADRRRARVDRHVVARGVGQRCFRVRREHQNRRSGPSERPRDRGPDREKRRGHLVRDAPDGHHGLGKAHADFGRLSQSGNLAGWLRVDDAQRRLLSPGGRRRHDTHQDPDPSKRCLHAASSERLWGPPSAGPWSGSSRMSHVLKQV